MKEILRMLRRCCCNTTISTEGMRILRQRAFSLLYAENAAEAAVRTAREERAMREMIDLYNVDRELTGRQVYREESLPADTYRLIIHVCVFNPENKMLIQKRADSKKLWPGYWDISAGGGVMAGETSREAAERETGEELGLRISFSERRPVISVNFAGGFDDFYTVEEDIDIRSVRFQADEITDIAWASVSDLEKMIDEGIFIPFDKELIRYLFIAREGKGSWNL